MTRPRTELPGFGESAVKHLTFIGECIVRHTDHPIDGTQLHIEHADPVVFATAEFIGDVIRLQCAGGPIRLDPSVDPDQRQEGGDLVGRLLRLEGVNRTVVYRLTEYDHRARWYRAEWPD